VWTSIIAFPKLVGWFALQLTEFTVTEGKILAQVHLLGHWVEQSSADRDGSAKLPMHITKHCGRCANCWN
jgi:hypothetical protein